MGSLVPLSISIQTALIIFSYGHSSFFSSPLLFSPPPPSLFLSLFLHILLLVYSLSWRWHSWLRGPFYVLLPSPVLPLGSPSLWYTKVPHPSTVVPDFILLPVQWSLVFRLANISHSQPWWLKEQILQSTKESCGWVIGVPEVMQPGKRSCSSGGLLFQHRMGRPFHICTASKKFIEISLREKDYRRAGV